MAAITSLHLNGVMGVARTFSAKDAASGVTVDIRIGGVWKEATVFIKVAGVWKEITAIWVKVAGVWKQL